MGDAPRYVVVVHGIGEQRAGETVLPVVQRIAEARRTPRRRAAVGNPLTLPALAGASTGGWSEFAGIPRARPARPIDAPWLPLPAAPAAGANLRFVDLCWADIPRRVFPLVGQSFADWSAGLIERLSHEDKSRGWVRDLLVHMRAGLVPVQAVLARRARNATRVVFDDFLGDVQLYAEHAPTRGAAVRRFHDVMARIEAQHAGERPRYTIVAHSLGTVLSLDALAFAHSQHRSRAAVAASGDASVFHLPGYHDGGELPEVDWALRVDNFVTLGSPIDKFLLLWPQAWGAYGDAAWLDPEFVARRPARIRHLNYCDEQDPVGHELDIAHSAPVVRALFEPVEERVYARYALPGVAHVGYWTDDALFRRIVDIAVDGCPPEQASAVHWFRNRAFFGVLLATYVALPVLGWLVATILCAYMLAAIRARDYPGVLLYLTLCSVAVASTIWLAHLMVMWRQVLHLKRVRPVASFSRTLWRLLFRVMIYGTPPLWAAGVWFCSRGQGSWYGDPLPRAATILGAIVSTSLLVSYVAVRSNWRRLRRARALDWSAIAR